jgi:hypothetical protein
MAGDRGPAWNNDVVWDLNGRSREPWDRPAAHAAR